MAIKVKGWRSEHVEIGVSENEIVALTLGIISKRFELTNVDGIDDKGRMYEYAEYATSHSWTTKEDRGEPTPAQKQALEFIAWLKGQKI